MFRRTLASVALLAALTGCSSDTPDAGGDAGATPGDATLVEVTISDGEVVPTGERVEVEVGTPVTFQLSSDVPGSLHVHSSPEQTIEFAEGDSEHEVTIDKPGLVDVELHDPAITVVQLEVR